MTVPDSRHERSPGLVIILTTTETEDEARTLATGLLEQRLAACVQLSEIDSLYVWQGEIATDPEVRLFIKTPAARVDAALQWLRTNHPYDVPQLVVLEAAMVNADYLAWAQDATCPI